MVRLRTYGQCFKVDKWVGYLTELMSHKSENSNTRDIHSPLRSVSQSLFYFLIRKGSTKQSIKLLMRVITQIQTRSPPSCCFGGVLSKDQPHPKDLRKDLRKRLNLMILNNLYPVELPEKSEEITRRSTFRNLVVDETPQLTPSRTKIIRTQSLPKTPKPQSIPLVAAKSTKSIIDQFPQPSPRVSSHSLERKSQPAIKRTSSIQNKISISQQTQSRSTATSKEPLSAFRKLEDVYPISESMNSSESLQLTSSKIARNPLTRIEALCSKQLKKSMYYQIQIQRNPKTKTRIDFFTTIPSSQLPNQYAISRQPSLDLLEIEPGEQEPKPRQFKQRSREHLRSIIMNH